MLKMLRKISVSSIECGIVLGADPISSMHRLATTGLTGLPIAQPWICL